MHSRSWGVVLAAVCLTASGCSGGSSQPPPPGPTSKAPSATPTPTENPSALGPPPTLPPPPKSRPGPKGQKKFARYVIRAWGYTLNTNNVEPIASLSPPGSSCLGCGSLTQVLKTRHLAHWHVDFPGVVVRSIQLHKTGRVIEADADVSIPQSDSFFDDGTFRSTSPAHDQSTFQVRMKLVRHHYRLVSFTVTPGP